MSDATPRFDPDRYELFEPPFYHFDVDRRAFLKTFGAGLVVLLVAAPGNAQESGRGGARRFGDDTTPDVSAWLHIAEDGTVTVFTGKAEMGQNIRTSLTQAVAEELGAPIAAITLLMADTAKTPYDMGTFGSRTTPTMNLQLRKVSAAARDVLIDRAAARWNVPRSTLTVQAGRVRGGDPAHTIGFGDLVKGGPLVASVTDRTVLRPAADWTIAGTSLTKVDGRAFVTGRHRFPYDLGTDAMLHGKIVRPPAYGATILHVDTSAAQAMPGVTVVHDGNFLGVAAPTRAAAIAAAAAVKAEWSAGSGISARTLFADLKTHVEGAAAPYTEGDVEAALGRGAKTMEAEYTVAYIAHAPLEPRAAVAEWDGDRVTAWTGSQRPFGVQEELMEAFHLPAGNVRVIVPDTGAAYGGKHTGDAAIEAARLARAAKRPVKVAWTREEEFWWAYFRPAGVIDVRATIDGDGRIGAWDYHNYNSGPAAIRTPYAIPNQRIAFHESRAPLRQGSYRGLAATANHFARESAMDELAHAAGADPLAFRLKNLRDDRLAAVLRAATDRFGWSGRRRGGGRGFGLAGGVEKGGYVATCVEIDAAQPSGRIGIVRVVEAFECGAVVNPDGLRNQIGGAIVQAIGGALFEAVGFDDGRLTTGRFAQYRVPRFSDVPPIDIVVLDRRDIPSAGAGETPIVGLAPAMAGAIFDATGARLRAMPLVPHGRPASTDLR